MNDAVILKSNRYGIHLKLNSEIPMPELINEIVGKFNESEKFFRNASFAISFEGRELSSDEEIDIIEAINSRTKNHIICIVDDNEIREQVLKARVDEMLEQEPVSSDQAKFHYGTVHSGQLVESDAGLIILGDVNAGAKVVSHGNIIILGSLCGKAHAGYGGMENAFICALDMNPAQLKINDLTLRDFEKSPLESLRKKRKGAEPKIAYIENGMITMDSVSKGLLNLI